MAKDEQQQAGSNGFDASVTPEYIGKVEEVQAKIDEIMDEAREKCAPLREEIAAIKKEANEESNLPRREFNLLFSNRRKMQKALASIAKLSAEQRQNYNNMASHCDDLTGTPLDNAASRKKAA